MSNKSFNFSNMTAFDFNSIGASSKNNCFGCDSCNCDVESHTHCDTDWATFPCDMSRPDPAYEPPKPNEPEITTGDKFENASRLVLKELQKRVILEINK